MINVVDIHKRHGQLEILRGISMTIAQGEVHLLVGSSGGGKTTLMRCIVGLETISAGRIEVGDAVLSPDLDPRSHAAMLQRLRTKIGLVFQQYHLFPHLTVLDNLTLAPIHAYAKSREEAEHRAMQLLERFGLTGKERAWPRQLSGGQQQRVAMARALMPKPEAVLFDEPTSALDPVLAAEAISLLQELAQEGLGLLIITHSMALARRMGGTLHVLHKGQVAETGPTQQLLDHPQHPVTQGLLAAARA